MKSTIPILALSLKQAAKSLNVSRTQLWRLTASGKLKKTSYGKIPVSEMERHLAKEVK